MERRSGVRPELLEQLVRERLSRPLDKFDSEVPIASDANRLQDQMRLALWGSGTRRSPRTQCCSPAGFYRAPTKTQSTFALGDAAYLLFHVCLPTQALDYDREVIGANVLGEAVVRLSSLLCLHKRSSRQNLMSKYQANLVCSLLFHPLAQLLSHPHASDRNRSEDRLIIPKIPDIRPAFPSAHRTVSSCFTSTPASVRFNPTDTLGRSARCAPRIGVGSWK